MKTNPKRGKSWCGCDRALLNDGQKCPKCGVPKLTKHFKGHAKSHAGMV